MCFHLIVFANEPFSLAWPFDIDERHSQKYKQDDPQFKNIKQFGYPV